MRNWDTMTPAMFDTDAKPVQGALFAAPDQCGTPDLFDSAPAAAPCACPDCTPTPARQRAADAWAARIVADALSAAEARLA